MKKIILMGKRCDETHDLFFVLKEHFDVKLCAIDYDVYQGVRKLFQPDLVVICFVKYTQPDKRFMELLSEDNRRVPVITVGLEMIDSTFEKIHIGGGMVNLTKVNAKSSIKDKACSMLGISPMTMDIVSEDHMDGGKPLILVVDDFALLLRQLRSMLKETYDVEVATSGVQAMSAIKRNRPDLILLDYAMPVHDGKQIFEALKMSNETRDIPVIFLTGVSEHDKVEEIIDMNPAGYLLKPPDKEKLLSMIKEVLERKERRKVREEREMTATGASEAAEFGFDERNENA